MLIKRDRSLIISCDVSLRLYKKIIDETKDIDGVGAYKIGACLALKYGLKRVVNIAKKNTNKIIIYDHQKAGTDIPYFGEKFIKVVKESGTDALIIFPMAGKETEKAWINSAKKQGLNIILGALMSHKAYLEKEGGWISEKILSAYDIALDLGIKEFVVPGNKIELMKKVRKKLNRKDISFYASGFIAQKGKIKEFISIFGRRCHPIIGRAIYESKDLRSTVFNLVRQL